MKNKTLSSYYILCGHLAILQVASQSGWKKPLQFMSINLYQPVLKKPEVNVNPLKLTKRWPSRTALAGWFKQSRRWILQPELRLLFSSNATSSIDAELLAINVALVSYLMFEETNIYILSDSRSSLENLWNPKRNDSQFHNFDLLFGNSVKSQT